MSDLEPSRDVPELEELLSRAGWMRGIARGLISDRDAAEDVVQDAYVAALRRPASARRDPRAWLRGVVRHLVSRRWRREGLRAAAEVRAGREESVEGAHEALERLELQRWLAGALLALEEPYRTAVVLRHLEGLDPGEIARRQGCSREAARQRVARGLERLRKRLDAEHGGRERWALLLAPLAARSGPGIAGAPASAGAALSLKPVLGVLLAVAAAVLVLLGLRSSAVSAGQDPGPVIQPAPEVAQASPPAPGTREDRATIREPIEGMEVLLSGANRDRGRLRPDSTLPPAGDWYVNSRHATSDGRGRFWFGALPAGDYTLRARVRGQPEGPSLAVSIGPGEVREGALLLHPRGETIRGTVVDESGNGLGGVYVTARLRKARAAGEAADAFQRGQASMRTGTSGAFELSGLPPGTYRLELHPFELESDPDFPWLSTALDEVESGADPLRIVLPRGLSIRGRLVDASGAALVGYTILGTSGPPGESVRWRRPVHAGSPSGATRDDGSFLLEVEPGTVWDLEVRGAPQTDAWETVFHTEPGIAAGTHDLVLQLPR